MTILAVSISAQTGEQAREQVVQAANEGAEAVELRTDFLQSLDASGVTELVRFAHGQKIPVIATCRDRAQGGAGEWPTEKRVEILVAALDAGAEWVDCEFCHYVRQPVQTALREALQRNPKARLILSAHDFSGPFEDLNELYESIVTVCPEAIAKLVYTARHINDCFEALDLLHDADREVIVLAMGPAGTISRILAKKLDAFLTFACLDRQAATAPGQVPVDQMKQLYQWDRIGRDTELFGLIGNPVGHSLSPAIYNVCFQAAELDAVYLPFWVEGDQVEFEAFVHHMLRRRWLHAGGFSVTIPHKTHALDFANHEGNFVENPAAGIGAVNTLKVGFNGIVSGYNTDCAGAIDALTESMQITRHDLHSMDVTVVGAGGVARAVVAGLTEAGAHITIYNRTLNKARSLAREFRCKAAPLEEIRNTRAKIIINCTSIGMHPDTNDSPVPSEVFRPDTVAFDTVYNPLETRFLQAAALAGVKTVSGAEMFVRQAVAQYRLLIGSDPDEKLIRETVIGRLKKET